MTKDSWEKPLKYAIVHGMTSDNHEHFTLRCLIWSQLALMTMLTPEYPTAKNDYLSPLIGKIIRYLKSPNVNNSDEMKEAELTIAQIRAEFETINAENRSFMAKFLLHSKNDMYLSNVAIEAVQRIVNEEINPEPTRKKPHLRVVR